MSKTKVLLLGAGFIADIHIESYKRFVPEAVLVGIYSRTEQRAMETARRHGIALLALMPVDPALARLVDEGRIEDMDSAALEPAADVLCAPRG